MRCAEIGSEVRENYAEDCGDGGVSVEHGECAELCAVPLRRRGLGGASERLKRLTARE